MGKRRTPGRKVTFLTRVRSKNPFETKQIVSHEDDPFSRDDDGLGEARSEKRIPPIAMRSSCSAFLEVGKQRFKCVLKPRKKSQS